MLIAVSLLVWQLVMSWLAVRLTYLVVAPDKKIETSNNLRTNTTSTKRERNRKNKDTHKKAQTIISDRYYNCMIIQIGI